MRLSVKNPLSLLQVSRSNSADVMLMARNYSFSARGQGQSETQVNQGFSRADFGGFLAIHPLPSNSVPLLLEPQYKRTPPFFRNFLCGLLSHSRSVRV